jgi:hypothetical protein
MLELLLRTTSIAPTRGSPREHHRGYRSGKRDHWSSANSAGSNRAANAWNGSAQSCDSLPNALGRPHEQRDAAPIVVHVRPSNWPVTPEVAGSSPVAPVFSSACRSERLVCRTGARNRISGSKRAARRCRPDRKRLQTRPYWRSLPVGALRLRCSVRSDNMTSGVVMRRQCGERG